MSDFTWILTSWGIVVAIVIIGVMVVWRILEDRKSGFPAQDERTKKITGKAAMYAFSIGNYFMSPNDGEHLQSRISRFISS